MTELITPPGAPVAAGPYSPGLVTGDWIFLSGQGGFDPETGELVSDNIADQTAQVFRNIEVLLRGRRVARRRRLLPRAPERSRAVCRVQRQLRKAVPGPGKAGSHYGGQQPGGRNAGGSDSSRPQARRHAQRRPPGGQVREACPGPPCRA